MPTLLESARGGRNMESLGRDYALQFHGLDTSSPEVREKFRTICLSHLDLTDQQALDILTARATRILCTDITPETLQSITRRLQEIGVKVDVADPTELEEVVIPLGSFSTDQDSTFFESQLYERPLQLRRTSEESFEDYSSGYVEDFFAQDRHFGLYSTGAPSVRRAPNERPRRHSVFLQRQRSLSAWERAGLFFVLVALGVLAAFFASR